jgi:transposase-like protein
MRRSLSIEEAIQLLHLFGISSNNMVEGVQTLLDSPVKGLSATNINRMKMQWKKEFEAWKSRDLSDREYCYIWTDGIHFNLRHDDNRLCTPVIIGALPTGEKELIAVEGGFRESTESWLHVLRDLQMRGLKAPKLAIGDGAQGVWKALKDLFPQTLWQCCWVHKTVNPSPEKNHSIWLKNFYFLLMCKPLVELCIFF